MPVIEVLFSDFFVTKEDPWLVRLVARLVKYHVWVTVWYPGREDPLVLDPTWTGLRLAPMRIEAYNQYKLGNAVVERRVVAMKLGDDYFPLLEPMTCVTIVKRMIGLRNPWVLTPRQLLRAIDGKQ